MPSINICVFLYSFVYEIKWRPNFEIHFNRLKMSYTGTGYENIEDLIDAISMSIRSNTPEHHLPLSGHGKFADEKAIVIHRSIPGYNENSADKCFSHLSDIEIDRLNNRLKEIFSGTEWSW